MEVAKTVEVVVAPTFVFLDQVQRTLKLSSYAISAQNCSPYKNGAYTGEISAEMLKDQQVPWVILGHSERRSLFGATDAVVGDQIKQALAHGIKVIACVGETQEERKSNNTFNVIERQMQAIVNAVGKTDAVWENIVVAYEPVWAIGTGLTATPAQAQEVHKWLREWMVSAVNANVANALRIIYGGSVKGSNADELASQNDIDGFLVGGASLVADEFVKIFTSYSRAKPAKL